MDDKRKALGWSVKSSAEKSGVQEFAAGNILAGKAFYEGAFTKRLGRR
ncbi:MAG: hypothetical protein GTO24_26060 [candidate division Zixibacteria bacterium]|nr:hypothetical protein [candidate division Zixibacteria bacterium]